MTDDTAEKTEAVETAVAATTPESTPPEPESPPKPVRTSIWDYDDGIVKGKIINKKATCLICEAEGIVVEIVEVTLPLVGASKKKKGKRMKAHHTLILCRGMVEGAIHPWVANIGISCGCLARAHRQLARIDQRVKDKAY